MLCPCWTDGLRVIQSGDTRALCQRLRHHLPHNRVIVGLWDATLDAERVRERLITCRPDRVVTNLAETLALVHEWEGHGVYPELAIGQSRAH